MVKNSSEQIEQDEKTLLSELVKNSKENIDKIAKHCGFSRQKAWRMIKRLEGKGVIWGYTAIVDDEKIGQKHFMLLINRTMEKMEEKVVDIIVSSKTNDLAKKLGVAIESSAYVNGEYDWIMTITAENILQAKRFSDALITLYPSGTKKITILETMMFIRKQHILNPDRKKLKDFM